MANACGEICERNKLTENEIQWLCAHQANKRIIDATARRANLSSEKVMMNIQKYGNTTSATLPLLLADYENQLKKEMVLYLRLLAVDLLGVLHI